MTQHRDSRVFKVRRMPSQARERRKAKAKALSLLKYRRKRGHEFELSGNVVLRALDFIDEEAISRSMFCILDEKTYTIPYISMTMLAKMLTVTYQTLWRWQTQTGQIPLPVFRTNGKGRNYFAYHVEEARVVVAVIGGHLNQFKYYRHDHTGTRDRLFRFVEDARATILHLK